MMRTLISRCAIWLALLTLAGCAATTPLSRSAAALTAAPPLTLHVQRRQGDRSTDWMLVLQAEGDSLRWSLLDPVGAPLARQLLHDGRWQADGLLAPNHEARELFAAVLFALTRPQAVSTAYPGGSWSLQPDGSRRLDPDWAVTYGEVPLEFTLRRSSGVAYRLTPLAAASAL